MPVVRIEVTRKRSAEDITAMIDAVYHAQIEAFKLPADDKQIRYIEHARECFPVPPGKTENYTIVEFSIFPGRSLDAKRKLYDGVVSRLGALGIEPRDIIILLNELPLENWGIRGKPASEIDIGFNLNV
ncbi:tautomerase family protein [Parachitinimonas caeni]|uniref:Tautomerase family protein n=1 Tax=Parachitinimonas caeni TaxID=3031301 RepID=A0ABT7E054_9NEIS|nr:tautomerase family protein [Parachitinimonas caeni]MDK2125683.1 tautomerase family protein [Parachitinimonas caeni]